MGYAWDVHVYSVLNFNSKFDASLNPPSPLLGLDTRSPLSTVSRASETPPGIEFAECNRNVYFTAEFLTATFFSANVNIANCVHGAR